MRGLCAPQLWDGRPPALGIGAAAERPFRNPPEQLSNDYIRGAISLGEDAWIA